MGAEVRLGDWADVLADIEECDAVICDPPYGERTHKGERTNRGGDGSLTNEIDYEFMTPQAVEHLVSYWVKRSRRWIAAMTSHDLIPMYEQSFTRAGWYGFAPVMIVQPIAPRMAGDGPSSGGVYMMVARPKTREAMKWRSLPGSYEAGRGGGGGRGKPIALMERIVCDYSNPGDLVVDPFSGWGSTGVACVNTRRRFIGAEIDPEAHAIATERVAGATPGLPGFADVRHEQIGLEL